MHVCLCVSVFLSVKSETKDDSPTVQSIIRLAEYLRRHDICDIIFLHRAVMDHAKAIMGASEGRYGFMRVG